MRAKYRFAKTMEQFLREELQGGQWELTTWINALIDKFSNDVKQWREGPAKVQEEKFLTTIGGPRVPKQSREDQERG